MTSVFDLFLPGKHHCFCQRRKRFAFRKFSSDTLKGGLWHSISGADFKIDMNFALIPFLCLGISCQWDVFRQIFHLPMRDLRCAKEIDQNYTFFSDAHRETYKNVAFLWSLTLVFQWLCFLLEIIVFLDPERLKTHREAPVTCWATADGAVQPKKVGFMNGCTTRWVKVFLHKDQRKRRMTQKSWTESFNKNVWSLARDFFVVWLPFQSFSLFFFSVNLALSPLSVVVCCARVWKRPKTWPWERPNCRSRQSAKKSKDGRPFLGMKEANFQEIFRGKICISPSQNLSDFFRWYVGSHNSARKKYTYTSIDPK